jgi:two-component system phosphate regulon sensor histidine kinase PhoR
VLVIGPDQRIAAANPAGDLAFSNAGLPVQGRKLSEVIRDLTLEESVRTALEDVRESSLRLEYGGPNAKKFDVHMSPIELEGTVFAIGYFHDTTRIDRLEKVRQEFLSNISHELRTPLTSIIAFVETLEDGAIDDPENNKRFLGVIRRNAERMNALIGDILELSLIESGSVSIAMRDVHLKQLVDDVATGLSSKAATREIRLVNRVDPKAVVIADSSRLGQMLTNLIENAIKFNRHGGRVEVNWERSSERDSISVTDTGEGILPEHLNRIFERFYRADTARSREAGGTGLGLAIVKHLARLHGGEVSVSSVLSEGSTFRIELPAK